MTKVVGYSSEEDFRRAANVIRYIERGGIDHPYYRRQVPVDVPELIIAKADAAVTQGSSGTFSIWDGSAAASLSDTGDNITAYVRFGDIASGAFVAIYPKNDWWEAIAAECG